jgi:hypothetical protein
LIFKNKIKLKQFMSYKDGVNYYKLHKERFFFFGKYTKQWIMFTIANHMGNVMK